MASSFGKMPTTLVRRLTSPFRRSRGLTERIFGPALLGEGHVGEDVCFGLVHKLGEPADRRPQLVGHFAPLGSGGIGIILGKAVAMKAETTRRPLLPAWASALRMK